MDMRAFSPKKSGPLGGRRGQSPPTATLGRRRCPGRPGGPGRPVTLGADGGRAGGAVHEGRLAEGGAGRARGADQDPAHGAAGARPLSLAAAARTSSAPASTTHERSPSSPSRMTTALAAYRASSEAAFRRMERWSRSRTPSDVGTHDATKS